MAKSPTAALKKAQTSEDKVQVPGKDGAVGADTPTVQSPPIFSAGDVIMIPVARQTLSRLGKHDAGAVHELTRVLEQYCEEGFATSDPHTIVVNNEQRKEMVRIAGRDFRTGDDVVRTIRRLLSVDLDFLEIGETLLPEHLLARLKTRCHNQDKDPQTARDARREVAQQAIVDGLQIFVGLK